VTWGLIRKIVFEAWQAVGRTCSLAGGGVLYTRPSCPLADFVGRFHDVRLEPIRVGRWGAPISEERDGVRYFVRGEIRANPPCVRVERAVARGSFPSRIGVRGDEVGRSGYRLIGS